MNCCNCDKPADRKWKWYGGWWCVPCLKMFMAPRPCFKCSKPSRPIGVERFAVASSDNDSYSMKQALVFVCDENRRHYSVFEGQFGPGAGADAGKRVDVGVGER